MLNKTKDEVAMIHHQIWKRQANFTEYPIPSVDGRYLMNSNTKCSIENPPLFLILVQTAFYNIMARNTIRETWGNKRFVRARSMHVVFLLGQTNNEQITAVLKQEQELHGDLVQGTFMDTYRNLTHKSVLGLRWATEYCRKAKFVVRIDDDVFLNPFRLIEFMETDYKDKARHIWCIEKPSPPIHRTDTSKFNVDAEEFKGMSNYPVSYCVGAFSIITNDLIPELFEASKITPLFWIEDVYMSGMLPYIVGNVIFKQAHDVEGYVDADFAMNCFTKEKKCKLVATYAHSPDQLCIIWSLCLRYYKTLTGPRLGELRQPNKTTATLNTLY